MQVSARHSSRTVDALSASIREATLTADYQLNGGGLRFLLTSNGGADWFSTPGVTHVFTTTGSDLRWRAELNADRCVPPPIITSLRVEYSTQAPYADDYEADDTCTTARPIAVNGATQAHTFHQQADADWAWFDATVGTTYIIETRNLGASVNTVIDPHRSCDTPRDRRWPILRSRLHHQLHRTCDRPLLSQGL